MDIFEVLSSKLEENVRNLKEHLGNGSCANHAEYSHVCGQIRGLKIALTTTKDLSRQYQEAEDD